MLAVRGQEIPVSSDGDASNLSEISLLYASGLTMLTLSFQNLSDAQGALILAKIGGNESIISVDLSGNEFNLAVGQSLEQVLTHNKTLRTLKICDNDFDNGAVVHIAKGLARNSGLEVFDISCNSFGSAGVTALARAIARNRSLYNVDLDGNTMNPEAQQRMIDAVGENHRLLFFSPNLGPVMDGYLQRNHEELALTIGYLFFGAFFCIESNFAQLPLELIYKVADGLVPKHPKNYEKVRRIADYVASGGNDSPEQKRARVDICTLSV